jgi:hypothetical protein
MRDGLKRHAIKAGRRREVGWHPLVAGSALARARSFILHPAALLILFSCRAPLARGPRSRPAYLEIDETNCCTRRRQLDLRLRTLDARLDDATRLR